jgi:hypothetical protein
MWCAGEPEQRSRDVVVVRSARAAATRRAVGGRGAARDALPLHLLAPGLPRGGNRLLLSTTLHIYHPIIANRPVEASFSNNINNLEYLYTAPFNPKLSIPSTMDTKNHTCMYSFL